MSEGRTPPDPPRLTREDDEAARLLERAAPRYRVGLDEARAWQRVERTRRRRATLSWGAGACAVAAVALGLASNLRESPSEAEVYAVSAEPLPLARPTRAQPKRDSPARVATPVPAEADRIPAPSVARRTATPPELAPTEARCKQWLADGKPERSVECFRAISRSSGLDAEVALYEAARLSAEALNDRGRALGLLEEHKKRFPNGALRGEVDWLRVQSLYRSGRLDDALSESEALLATPAGRSLASDLHALRGRIFQDSRRDCDRAVREFVALVGEPGARGDDAELRRARCLEQLGRSADAAQAYEHYLARPDAKQRGEARARLSTLRE